MTTKRNAFRTHATVLDALRSACSFLGLKEFMPPGLVPGFAHHPYMHATLQTGDQAIILPYQLSLHNRVAAHYLDRPTFCVGPCYRDDERSPFHRRTFTQFAFEIFGDDLETLEQFVRFLLKSVLDSFSLPALVVETVDALKGISSTDDELKRQATDLGRAIIIKNKFKGVPPLLNVLLAPDHEQALELILPVVGETLDGGVRDPNVLEQIYGIAADRQTIGASFGVDRLVAFLLAANSLDDVQLV